ncbi:MAG: haloalkane dehalogenase [Gammaproteobacteria bacterium]|nr:haloalkane dehalogenase [Gammaproteobacteria bacterium]
MMRTQPSSTTHRFEVLGLGMTCEETGHGDPVVFLHGNPTSSYLWRHVITEVADHARCLAPDLIGMGGSDKLPDSGPDSYRFVEHRRYLEALLDQLDLGDRVTLVVHDWGSALGFDWARRNTDRVRGIAYMEALVRPLSWDDWPEQSRPIFEGLRSPAGEKMILEKNVFVERILPASIMRELDDAEMERYRAPFAAPGESRRPTLTWPRQLPIDGEPGDVVEIVAAYSEWLKHSDLPKLFINADPGAILVGSQREFCRGWPNQLEITVPGIHFIQEDSGPAIGQAIAGWFDGLD